MMKRASDDDDNDDDDDDVNNDKVVSLAVRSSISLPTKCHITCHCAVYICEYVMMMNIKEVWDKTKKNIDYVFP